MLWEVSSISVYHISTPSHTSLWLIPPDLVLVLIGFEQPLVVMFAGKFLVLATMQSSLSSHATCLNLALWLVWTGVTWSLSPPSSMDVFVLPTNALEPSGYDLSNLSYPTSTICVKMSSHCPVPFFICSERYCSVVTLVLSMCLMFTLLVCPFSSLWWCKIFLCGHCS